MEYVNNTEYTEECYEDTPQIRKEQSCSKELFASFLKSISTYPILSQEETVALFEKMKKGDKQAREELINKNLKLVVFNAKHFFSSKTDIMDLIQEGTVGLIKAVDSYDSTRGAKFSFYASTYIRFYLCTYIERKSYMVKVSASMANNIYRYKKLIASYEEKGEPIPSDEVLQEKIGVSDNLFPEVKTHARNILSLSADYTCEDNDSKPTSLENLIPSNEHELMIKKTEDDDRSDFVKNQMLPALNEKEQMIIVRKFGLDGNAPWTFSEIAKKEHLSGQRIAQIAERAIRKLKCAFPKAYEWMG